MSLTDISPSVLREVLRLHEKKEKLQDEIKEIDARIDKIGAESGAVSSAPAKRRGRPRKASRKRAGKRAGKRAVKQAASAAPRKAVKRGRSAGRSGTLKDKVIDVLQSAGAQGMKVSDLARAVKSKPQNLFVWFNSTGKKLREVQKIGPGHYRWKS